VVLSFIETDGAKVAEQMLMQIEII